MDELEDVIKEVKLASVSRIDGLYQIINALYRQFGRMPTEGEVFGFITGSYEDRFKIWNKEVSANTVHVCSTYCPEH